MLAMLAVLCLTGNPVLAGGNGSSNSHGGNAGGNGGDNGKGNAGGNGKGNAGGNGGADAAGSGIQDENTALGLREAGAIHPLNDAYAAAERQFGGEVIDATLERSDVGGWTYDLRLVTEDGRVRTLSYDATTLALRTIDGKPVRHGIHGPDSGVTEFIPR
jgi:hypothetical protein